MNSGSNNYPRTRSSYRVGVAGKYFIKGLIDDPTNSFIAYLFATDINVNLGTFGVFKMNFTSLPYKYNYTAFTMSSGSYFSVNSIVRTSLTDANDFYFAGKTRSFTDGFTSQTFQTGYGYLMKGKTSE